MRPRGLPRHIPARRHEADVGPGGRVSAVRIVPPVAVVPLVDSIVARWWFRADPYPVGALTGTTLPTP